jgi:hypothetical protein
MHFSINHSVLYSMARVRYDTEQLVSLVQLYYKYESIFVTGFFGLYMMEKLIHN